MYLIDPLHCGRYCLIALPHNADLAYGRIHIDHRAGISELAFESWEIGQFMGGN